MRLSDVWFSFVILLGLVYLAVIGFMALGVI